MGFDHNLDEVADDVRDVKDDLEDEMESAGEAHNDFVHAEARRNIQEDPDVTGDLLSTLRRDKSVGINDRRSYDMRFWVSAGGPSAPYGAVVELGSGDRSNESFEDSLPSREPERPPEDYPFDAPDTDPTFIAGYIEDWMRRKNLEPEKESMQASAAAIAATIVDKGTYAHPFLAPAQRAVESVVETRFEEAVAEAFGTTADDMRGGI